MSKDCEVICEERNIGDYFELVSRRDELEKECFKKIDEIVELKLQKKEDDELKNSLEIEKVYENYIKNLTEKLEVFKVIIEDLQNEFESRRELLGNSEKALILQKKALDIVETEKSEKERKLQEEIDKVQLKFNEKQNQLIDFKSEYMRIQNLLELSHEVENSLQLDVAKTNFDLYRVLCKIKTHNDSNKDSENCPKIDEEMIENLQTENQRISLKIEAEDENVHKMTKEILDLQNEIDFTRSDALRKLKVIKLHNKWKDEHVNAQKLELEIAIKECKENFFQEDQELLRLKESLELMKIDCSEAEKTIQELNKSISQLEYKPKCHKSSFDPHPNYQIPKPKIFIGTDYIGSKFIKIDE